MHAHRHSNSPLATGVLAVLDTLGILIAYLWAVYYTLPWEITFDESIEQHIPYFLIFAVFWFGAAVDQGLFGLWSGEEIGARLFSVIRAIGNALVISTVIMAVIFGKTLENEFMLTFCIDTLICLLMCRFCVRMAVSLSWQRGHNLHRILILGANERTEHLLTKIIARDNHGYDIVGFVEEEPDRAERLSSKFDISMLGRIDELEGILEEHQIDEVFISLPVRSFYEEINGVAQLCEKKEIPVCLVADLFSLKTATSKLVYVEDIPMLSLSTIPEIRWKLGIKRAVDIVVSSILLIALSPFFIFLAIALKIESRGPVFFAQERVGQNQRRFDMLKFRSMVANAEDLREELEELNEADGPVFKIKDDPRITRIGKFIRKYSVDEFPQLMNVWVGQMSLVGPRPPLASEVEQYSWDQRRRLSVKPGMTGLWQVSGRSDVGFQEWVELDLTYIDSWSLWEDFIILLKTFKAVYAGRGAR